MRKVPSQHSSQLGRHGSRFLRVSLPFLLRPLPLLLLLLLRRRLLRVHSLLCCGRAAALPKLLTRPPSLVAGRGQCWG